MSHFFYRLAQYADEYLNKGKHRGLFANLRCVLVENKKHRAWPTLHRIGIAIDDKNAAFVAGLFATHPNVTDQGNFGAMCKTIEQKNQQSSEKDKLTPTEKRFQHLLSAEKGDSLYKDERYKRVLRLVLMAKSHDVPVNYQQLKKDLFFWNDRTKTEWAASFWTQSEEPKSDGTESEANAEEELL